MSLVPGIVRAEWETYVTAGVARRLLDGTMAAAGLILLSPLLALIGLAIWISDGRPIFFSQIRLGQKGRHFRIYKFRKFHKQCDQAAGLVTVKNDSRFTRLGWLLDRMKLDELPQLWNILKGDMSIVGPRPETIELGDCFANAYLRVLDYKPGIFGPNQVLFRNECSLYPTNWEPEIFYKEVLFPLKANIDLAYFAHRTLLSDIGWILRCMLAICGWPSLSIDNVEGQLISHCGEQNWRNVLSMLTPKDGNRIVPGE